MLRSTSLLLCVALGLSACATSTQQADVLAGTQWQLLSIQSMDDAQGTTRIADPTRYTLSFNADGRAAMRLDCNRGSAGYQAQPAGADSGSLKFGAVAMTRALCPPGSLDVRVGRDLSFVRGYLFKGGRLHLSLQADGGIYEWAPLAQ